ncbi:MAG: trypsin-like peptidase domain-containing protein [Victivallaceae bacterium]|nr:trypsin-like peptidase domain-containing protein [Victivallaceae bacterium]
MRTTLTILLTATAALGAAAVQDATEYPQREWRITPVVRCVRKAMPSVVYLSAERLLPTADNTEELPFAPQHEPTLYQAEYALGSGCVVDPAGLILTNSHVVTRTPQPIVTLGNGARYRASVVANDSYNDLALLKVTVPADVELRPLAMAEPGDLLLGETVVTVGNPYGLGGTIVEGVLSAVNRRISYENILVFDDLLQTDAPIHPGHSGAPLINLNGEMIGITLANLQDAPGISFAIPQQRIADLLGLWLIPERFSDVSLGIVPALRRAPDGELQFYLQDVIPNSPAEKAGLYRGMFITHFNGKLLEHDIMEISGTLWQLKSGDTVTLAGEGKTVTVKAEEMPARDWNELAKLKLGLSLRPLTPKLAEELSYPDWNAMAVATPPPGNQSVKRGDLLVQLGDANIYTPDDLSRALENIRYGQEVTAVLFEPVTAPGPIKFKRKTAVLSVNKTQ